MELAQDAWKLFTSALGVEEDPMALVQAAVKASCDYAMPVCGGPGTNPPAPLSGKEQVCDFVEKSLEVAGGILKYEDDNEDEAGEFEAAEQAPSDSASNTDFFTSVTGVGLATAGVVLAIAIPFAVVLAVVIHRNNKVDRLNVVEEESAPALTTTVNITEETERAAYGSAPTLTEEE